MYKNRVSKKIFDDYNFVLKELLNNNLYRDGNSLKIIDSGSSKEIITWANKKEKNVMYDTYMDAQSMMENVLMDNQYLIELYDKSVFQFECIVEDEEIKKIRMVFFKKDNIIWEIDKLNYIESQELEQDDWFEHDFGIPIMIRIDYDPMEYVDVIHSKTHMTLFNSQNCRIPMKTYFMFSEFVYFILDSFYNIQIRKSPICYNNNISISANELKVYHINWE